MQRTDRDKDTLKMAEMEVMLGEGSGSSSGARVRDKPLTVLLWIHSKAERGEKIQ